MWWIAINKLKGVTPSELAENIEGALCSCLEIDVWKINDPKEYSDLRNKIILDKSFKKNDKKLYKQFVSYSKYYQLYLKNEFISKAIEDKKEKDETLAEYLSDNKINEIDAKKIFDFFGNVEIANKFCSVYEYAMTKCSNLVLDVRVTIIGVKLDGERLRFYSDKKTLKFSKIN